MLFSATNLLCSMALSPSSLFTQNARATAPVLLSAAESLEGKSHETGLDTVWDPLGLADLGSPATLAWMRHAQLKHGRVCMAAFLGWLIATGNQLAVQNGHEGIH